MASLLDQMLQPAQPLRVQAPQTPQAQPAPHPQGSNTAQQVVQGVAQAAQIAAMFL